MQIDSAWLKPPAQIGGLDHLSVQAPCINIYGRLLPGITNVTDRARYYSFYPWLIWSFDQQGYTTFDDEFVERFRRADCLFSLIAARHAIVSDGDSEDHEGGAIGIRTLRAIARELRDGGTITVSNYSLREGAQARYFMNKMGGLGQYYIGVLRELLILDGNSSTGIKYTNQIGKVIAKSADRGLNGELFLDVVDRDLVTQDQLDELSGFCPCQLTNNEAEVEILRDLFFARNQFYDPEALPRRRTLQTTLELADLLANEKHDLTIDVFRACIYSGALPSGASWPVRDSLQGNRDKWAIYARNELLSVAVQGLFYALLDAYQEYGDRLDSSQQIVDWYINQPETNGVLNEIGEEITFTQCVFNSSNWLPALPEWVSPLHEAQLAESIWHLCRAQKSEKTRKEIIEASVRIIIALAARIQTKEAPYGELVFDKGYFQYYSINLKSFEFHRTETWAQLTLREVVRWLLLGWGIEAHLKVALRKLRVQSQSTFRIRPSDSGFEVISAPQAAHTQPRFYQVLRILKDIGALEKTASDNWRPSAIGRSILEQGDAP